MSDTQICSNCGKEIKKEPAISIGVNGIEKVVFCSDGYFTKWTKSTVSKIKEGENERTPNIF